MAHVTLIAERSYDLPPSAMWPTVADLDGYADHVAGLLVTEVVEGSGEGAIRRCEVRGGDWTERVVEWDNGHRYVVEVDTTSYPQPLRALFRRFTGAWTVEPTHDGSLVRIELRGEVRGGAPVAALVRRLTRRNRRELEQTLESYGVAARADADRHT